LIGAAEEADNSIVEANRRGVMGATVVIEGVVASDLPKAWRQRVGARGNEVLTVTITKRKKGTMAKTAKKPNATFGMWADRADVNDPAAYARALRQTRAGSRRSVG
jgi:hypothetical protein